jgi:hypothetical protein
VVLYSPLQVPICWLLFWPYHVSKTTQDAIDDGKVYCEFIEVNLKGLQTSL